MHRRLVLQQFAQAGLALGSSQLLAAGSWLRNDGSSALIPSTTLMVLVPGWRWTKRMIERVSVSIAGPEPYSRRVLERLRNQLADLSFSTLSTTEATSPSRTALPLR